MPYSVLWVLPAWKNPQEFTPRYGKVIAMTPTPAQERTTMKVIQQLIAYLEERGQAHPRPGRATRGEGVLGPVHQRPTCAPWRARSARASSSR